MPVDRRNFVLQGPFRLEFDWQGDRDRWYAQLPGSAVPQIGSSLSRCRTMLLPITLGSLTSADVVPSSQPGRQTVSAQPYGFRFLLSPSAIEPHDSESIGLPANRGEGMYSAGTLNPAGGMSIRPDIRELSISTRLLNHATEGVATSMPQSRCSRGAVRQRSSSSTDMPAAAVRLAADCASSFSRSRRER